MAPLPFDSIESNIPWSPREIDGYTRRDGCPRPAGRREELNAIDPSVDGNKDNPGVVLKAAQRRAAVVTASILASIVVFAVIVEVLKRIPDYAGGLAPGNDVVRIVFYAVSISMVFVTNLINGFMLRGDRSEDIDRIAAKLTRVNIIVSGLAETPLLLGFVLFVVWGYGTDFYILGFVSFYLAIRHFPYYGQWEKTARRRMGEGWT